MSTKAYGGLRIKNGDLQKFLLWFRDFNITEARNRVKNFIEHIDPKLIEQELNLLKTSNPDLIEKHKDNPDFILNMIKMREVLSCESLAEMLSCWFDAWPYENYWIINGIFSTGSGYSPKEKPGFIEDFAYWNNSDPLGSVSEEEWKEREDAWETVLEEGDNKMSHVVFLPKKFETFWVFLGMFAMNGEEINTERMFLSSAAAKIK